MFEYDCSFTGSINSLRLHFSALLTRFLHQGFVLPNILWVPFMWIVEGKPKRNLEIGKWLWPFLCHAFYVIWISDLRDSNLLTIPVHCLDFLLQSHCLIGVEFLSCESVFLAFLLAQQVLIWQKHEDKLGLSCAKLMLNWLSMLRVPVNKLSWFIVIKTCLLLRLTSL